MFPKLTSRICFNCCQLSINYTLTLLICNFMKLIIIFSFNCCLVYDFVEIWSKSCLFFVKLFVNNSLKARFISSLAADSVIMWDCSAY